MPEKPMSPTKSEEVAQYYLDCAMDTVLVLRYPLPRGRGRALAALMGDDLADDPAKG
jgi:hypothetical protein